MSGGSRVIAPVLVALALAAAGCASAPRSAPYAPPSAYGVSSPEAENRDLPVTPQDLRILERADAILADSTKWNRHDDRVCTPADTAWSLFCALQRACVEVLGEYDHRRAALQEVRFAVEAVTPGQVFEHRLRDYNNLPTTRFADIRAVLRVARQRVAERLAGTSR